MRRGIGCALFVSAALGLSLLTGPAAGVVPQEGSSQRADDETFLSGCSTAEQMECIEAVEYVLDGEWKSAAGPFAVRTIISDDGEGNIVYGRDMTYFDTPGLKHAEGAGQVAPYVAISPFINGPEFPAYKVFLQPTAIENGRYRSVDPAGLERTSYRLSFRTSRLVPIFSQLTTIGASATVVDISGGRRVSVSGEPGPSQFAGDGDEAERNDRALAITYEWHGFISDARARNGVLRGCQGLGIVTAYSNGYGGQMPEWDAGTGTLSFGTGGFHYAPDGKVYRGRAEISVPGPLARCMWQVDPRQTARMEIEVFAENGEEAAGTKSIGYDAKSDLVKMIAIDFTYSEKHIAARLTPLAVTPGKKTCDDAKTVCVAVDKGRKSARVTIAKLQRDARAVFATALRGAREDPQSQVKGRATKGKVAMTVKLAGSKSLGQVWVLRTQSTFIGSFKVK